ncbi:MAG TPA: POTRA domain-containing protein [Thermoanaerobaculia bacterium]|nr:POTRA domain-containing protein [Thermoanaerobaculia bacterium]
MASRLAIILLMRLLMGPLAGLLAGAPLQAQEAAPAAQTAAPPAPQFAPEPGESSGPKVTGIEIRSDAPLPESQDTASLIEAEVGEPLTQERIRHTLRNLQASGTAAETELYTREDPDRGGVVAVVVFRAVTQVSEVRVTGRLGLSRDDLRRAIPQGEAQPLSEDKVLQGVDALKNLYDRNGYFRARVRVAVETNPVTRRAVVTYRVNSGPRATVSAIAFEPSTDPFQPAQLVKELRLQPGKPFSRRVAREGAERLQDWLIRQQYGEARVDPPREERERRANTVKLTYPVVIGPKIVLKVEGADEKKLRRQGLLPFFGESGFDEALVLQAQTRIKTWYQQQGHYDVRVDTGEQKTSGELVLTIKVTPGPVYTLREIVFQGNAEIPDAKLLDLMKTSPPILLRRGSGRLVQSDLDADVDNLQRYYALSGYTQATVGPPQVERRGEDLRLVIPVKEGPRERVASLSFQGMTALDPAKLRQDLKLHELGGFHPVLLENTLDYIRGQYAAKGYTRAQVSSREEWHANHTLVDLTIEVLEGPREVADRILVRGNQRTLGDVIRRTLDLRHGDPVSQAKLFETERNLYQLGIFSRVDVEFVPSGLEETERDVLIRVEEGKPRGILYGFGWDSETRFRGSLAFTDNNVWGRAYSLRTDLRWSQRDKRFHLLFNQPYLGEYPVSLTSSVFHEQEAPSDRPYEVTRYGARVEAARVYGNRRYGLGFDYRIVEPSVDPGIASNQIERLDQPYYVTSFVPSFFLDRRDDPISPTRGWSSLAQVQYAFPVLAFHTDTEFLKVFLQQTQYVNLGRPGVLAGSVRVGTIAPFKAIPTSGGLVLDFPSRNVPIAERFFAGGDATHRAYGRDELGIRGQTLILNPNGGGYVPVGGDGLLLINLEYRFPIAGDFGGTLFFDSGNVWPDWRSIRLGELKNGIGLGARYNSPIGPVRAGIGFKLNRERGEQGYALFVNIGNPF